MKILAIRGKNLASLEGEFEIDFASDPLKSAGIFVITGSTGAGKSTILDALCLSLFDDTPRTNNAGENIQIKDVQDNTINQKDSRNILRRGTIEGYAEVDFMALSGDKYRSRWMVRRARGRADGALQKTEVRLENLSTGVEEQGTKTEILLKIVELIGLSFDQFTRAVLLAQGDFATFLKAKQSDKAELLEKLTGTEIYSKISSQIYQRTKEAEQALNLLNERIKDVRLLTDEELEALIQEKIILDKDLIPLKSQLSDIDKKLAWIKLDEQIRQEVLQAECELKKVHSLIEEAKPRYEYISKIDLSQEIRDTYIELSNKQKHLVLQKSNLFEREKEQAVISDQLKQAEQNLTISKIALEEHGQKYTITKPDIAKAKELDIKIQSGKEKVVEAQKEFGTQSELKKQVETHVQTFQKDLKTGEQILNTLTEWFEKHDSYKEIVPRIDLIVNLLNDAQASKSQSVKASNSLETNLSILKTRKEKLEKSEKEYERLNNLLPSEILALRLKLEDNAPCPVCGSIHHPIQNTDSKNEGNLQEKELEQAKKLLSEAISADKEQIEAIQKEITQLETLIKNYKSQYDEAVSKLSGYLQHVSDWEIKLEQNSFQSELSEIANQWNQSKERLDKGTKYIESTTLKLESENKNLVTIVDEFSRREELFKNVTLLQGELIKERSTLLEGKSVEEVETLFEILQKQFSSKYEELRTQKDKLESDNAKIGGFISQIKGEIHTESEQVLSLQESVQDWINHNDYQISSEILNDLMAKSREWIALEKVSLSDLKNQELTLNATLKERNTRQTKHGEEKDKPEEGQNKETLTEKLSEIENKSVAINKRLTEIEVAFATHNAGKERIKAFEKELNEKVVLCENWKKLNVLLGSADGGKFKAIAQGYTLDILLVYANKHLEELSKRYKLQRIPDTLALQVVDNDMLGEIRTVHSLSGGESFLISLSLALGLSSLSSNRMKIESLFIDEGFGSLDIDTLSIAMDALENLQTQGRKIGVISHVAEMTERITTRVQVIKSANGRSKISVVG
ncbi:ATP-dependent exonuclease [Dysgonomonas sp. HDW5B]|uniref:AAA family ATPase n=1 Tax=Dysgonomonas sp. HDW5B TaxID=2714927 RepID=UPI00140BFED0|nr:AAA family ATPase [Dysgonomonas sp. HDW5B]QIK54743.1 ATP-dependent exonuclease [Dysgonomonas sp. HDW5B]